MVWDIVLALVIVFFGIPLAIGVLGAFLRSILLVVDPLLVEDESSQRLVVQPQPPVKAEQTREERWRETHARWDRARNQLIG